MKPTGSVRQLRDTDRPRVSHPSVLTSLGPSAFEQRRGQVSEALQLATKGLNLGNEFVLTEFQRKVVKRTTAVVTDAMLGAGASPSLRLLVRRALRTAVTMAFTGTFLMKLCALIASLHQLDFAHDIKADADLASAVDSLLCPAAQPTLLARATLFTVSALTCWLNLSTTTDSLVHLDFEHMDFLSGAGSVLDLAVSAPALMESAKGLFKIRSAFSTSCDAKSVAELVEGDDKSSEER